MTRKLLIILTIVIALPALLSAQNSRTLYFMNLPQNRLLNPAFRPSDSVNIALPASGFGMSFNNNWLNFSDLIVKGRSDSLITFIHPDYDPDDFLAGIRQKNTFDFDFSLQLLGLGFNAGKTGYLFIDVNERFFMRTALPGDLFKFALKGNEPFAGNYLDLSSMKADMQYYHEIGAGYSWNITNKLRGGVKGKFLLGVMSSSIANRSLGIAVEEDYSHIIDADVAINMSAPYRIIRDRDGNIDDVQVNDEDITNTMLLKGTKNPGFAFDLGATYDLTEKIVISAAVTDLGLIRWKRDITNLRIENTFEFSGIEMTDVINGEMTFEEAGEELLDSLNNAFSPAETHIPFSTYIPAGLNIGGSYRASKNFTFGVLSGTRFMGGQVKESLTMSANMNLGSSLLASLSYTASNHRLDNFGAGLALRLSIFQFYIMSDRIPVYWNKLTFDDENGGGSSSVPIPANWNTFDLRFGMNLVFGHRKKKVSEECAYEVDEPEIEIK